MGGHLAPVIRKCCHAVILTTVIMYMHSFKIYRKCLHFLHLCEPVFPSCCHFTFSTLAVHSPPPRLSFSIRLIFSIAFICLFPSHTRTIHHPVDRSIDFALFHQHTPKRKIEHSLNMSVCEASLWS